MVQEMSAGPTVIASHESLEPFCIRVFEKLGVPRDEAGILVTANLRGVDIHGVLRMPVYVSKLKDGALRPAVHLTTEKETVATALLDDHDGIGQVIGFRAMQTAIRKAGEAGVSGVSVRSSNHFGAAAYYPMMALESGMIDVVLSNASPRLAPTGGYKGYGITLMVDLLTGVLSDSNFGTRVKGIDQDAEPAGVAHAFLAVNLAAFTDAAAFGRRMDAYIEEIKSSRKARGSEVIYVPGDPEHLRVLDRKEKGITLPAKVVDELRVIGKDLGVPPDF